MLGLDTLELADQYAPLGEARPVGYDEGRSWSTPRSPASRRGAVDRRGLLHRSAGRRRAPSRQARRGVLLAGRPRRQPLCHAELDGHDERRADDRPRARSRHALPALARGPVAALGPHRPGAGRGALDLRGVRRLRPPARKRGGSVDAAGAGVSERVEGAFATIFRQTVLARYEQAAYALRAGSRRSAADRLGDIWSGSNLRYYGDSIATCRTAIGWAGRTSPTSSRPASTPTPTRSRSWSRWRCTRATARTVRSSSRRTWSSWPPGDPRRPPTCWPCSESTSPAARSGTRPSRSWSA